MEHQGRQGKSWQGWTREAERTETVKCHPADKNQLSSCEAVKNCSFPLELHLNNKPLHLEGAFLSSANEFIYCTTWMPTMRLCPWITEISLCKLFLVIRTIFTVVQYQNINRNLPLYRKGVQSCGKSCVQLKCDRCVCWRKVGVLCAISNQITSRSNIHLLQSDFVHLLWFPPKTPPEL